MKKIRHKPVGTLHQYHHLYLNKFQTGRCLTINHIKRMLQHFHTIELSIFISVWSNLICTTTTKAGQISSMSCRHLPDMLER